MNPSKTRQAYTTHTTTAAETNYYPSEDGLLLGGVSAITIQGVTSSNVTTTIEATNGDTEIDGQDAVWYDVTASFADLGVGLTTPVTTPITHMTGEILQGNGLAVGRIRVKSVSSASGETESYIFEGV